MGVKTDIEWCDSTSNFTSGCDGCELWNKKIGVRHCYAGQIHERFSPSKSYPGPFEQIDIHPGRMMQAARWSDLAGTDRPRKPWLNGLPRVIFVGDMADVYSHSVPYETIESELIEVATSREGSRHIYMTLTKQPVRAAKFARWLTEERGIAWPANIWSGVSVTSERTQGRAEIMCYHPAPVKFLSVEPMLGPVSFAKGLLLNYRLLIVGGESGHGSRPCQLSWIRSIVRQCRESGTPVFVKQLGSKPYGEWLHGDPPTHSLSRYVGGVMKTTTELSQCQNGKWNLHDGKGGLMEEWPTDLRIREFPRQNAVAE